MSDIISSLMKPNITSIFLGSSEDPEPIDDFCGQLKFFVKLIYILTGECKLQWNMSREELIQRLAPVSEISGYLSITSWLFAQIPQVIKNYSDKSVDGLSLGFLLCWFAGDFLNFTSCLMTDAFMFQILLSGYYCIIDFILAGQYFYYSHLYYDPKSRFFYKKRSQRMNVLKSPRSRLRETLEEHDMHVNKISKKKQGKNSRKSNHHNSKQTKRSPIIVAEIGSDSNDPTPNIASVPTERISIPNIRTPLLKDRSRGKNNGDGDNDNDNYNDDNDDDDNDNELEGTNRKSKNFNLFSNKNNSFTKLISSSFIAGFTKVDAMPIPTEDFPTDIEITEKRKSALDKIMLQISAILHFLRYMDSHTMGKVFAWTCTFCYLSSRVPQLMKNYKLKSTKGISLKLFMCALVGNTLYSVSLATCRSSLIGGEESKQFWSDELSYMIGACGTVVFDIIVIIQWYIWDYRTKNGNTPFHRGRNTPHHNQHSLHQQQHVPFVHPNTNTNVHVLNKTTNQFKTINRSIVISDQSSLTSRTNMRSPLGGGVMGGSYSASSMMGGRLGTSSPFNSSSKPILILSPNHIRKLSEFTPLSPIDFLTEEYMATNSTTLNNKDKDKEKDKEKDKDRSAHAALNRYQNKNGDSSTTSISSTPYNTTNGKARTYSTNNESAITIESSEHDSSHHNIASDHDHKTNTSNNTINSNYNNESNDNTLT